MASTMSSTPAPAAGTDLLSAPADRLVSLQYVLAALRRKRRVLVAIGAAGLCLGLVLTVAVPKKRTATTALLLQFPVGADPTRAMSTDVSLLQTRTVAESALKALGLDQPTAKFQSSYRGTILSDAVLRISVTGPDEAEAVRRSNALSHAFLGFRKQVYERQLAVVIDVLKKRENELQVKVASLDDAIFRFDPNRKAVAATRATTLADLLSQRSGLTSDIGQIDSAIQDDTLATATVVNTSRVIDPGSVVPVSPRRVLALNAASGLIGALGLGVGAITLLAVTTTRVRRRADIAAALRAPVLLSVGRVLPSSRLRLVPAYDPMKHPSDDLKLVVRHLQSLMTSAAAQPPALVVVAIDNVAVAAAAVTALSARLARDDQEVVVVNETRFNLAAATSAPEEVFTDPARSAARDIVVVVAALDPAKGAEHLREWATDAVVLVTAGRSTVTTLESNAAMIRAAGLHLRSVILVGCDPDDDSLGAFDTPPPAPAKRAAARAPRQTTRARTS